VRAGIKPSGDLDLALVVSDAPATVAGAFTTNKVAGAPVQLCRPRVAGGRARGVVVSAGIANVATGEAGLRDAERMADAAADAVGVSRAEMLVSSTGLIGPRIPMDRVLPAIGDAAAVLSTDGGEPAARAIMTTDTRPKMSVRHLDLDGRRVTVGGMAKGAGMICPRMAAAQATMLVFITTDAVASKATLAAAIGAHLDTTFNSITVDGCTSTSDTVLLFANGASGADVDGHAGFVDSVGEVMAELAYAVVADGEGASKVIRIRVSGAASDDQARVAAREIANSVLFRAAIWGGDPNWGRVAQALGQAPGLELDPDRLDVTIGGVLLASRGEQTRREDEAAATLEASEVVVEAELGRGSGAWEILTCDLSPDYVRFNADYTT